MYGRFTARARHFCALAFSTMLSSHALAALPDDVPACRCLENLSETIDDALSEDIRREATRIVDDYCEENLPLSDLSGRAQWIANESCMLLHRGFQMETEMLADERDGAGFEIRLSVRAEYDVRRLNYVGLFDWRHHTTVFARVHFTFRPARMRHFSGDLK